MGVLCTTGSATYPAFGMTSTWIIMKRCLHMSLLCLEEAAGSKLETQLFHFNWNCTPASRESPAAWKYLECFLLVTPGDMRSSQQTVRQSTSTSAWEEFIATEIALLAETMKNQTKWVKALLQILDLQMQRCDYPPGPTAISPDCLEGFPGHKAT